MLHCNNDEDNVGTGTEKGSENGPQSGNKFCAERLKKVGMFSQEKRKLGCGFG